MSSNNQDAQTPVKVPEQKSEVQSDCSAKPTGFNAFKQAVVDTGNAILCKTVRSPDSEKCKKKVDPSQSPCGQAKSQPQKPVSDGKAEGGCKKEPKKDKPKSTNPLNPTSPSTPEKTLEFVKFFTDDGR